MTVTIDRPAGAAPLRRAVDVLVPPAVFGVGFVAIWELTVKIFDLKPYFVPAPSAIVEAFFDNFGNVREAAQVSGTNALVGLLAGLVLGVVASFLLMRFRVLNELATPLAIALNAIPIIVLVSIFITMYPATSEMPRRLMVTLVVFFIVLINVAKGLRQVHPAHVELMRSYAASPLDVLRKARIPERHPVPVHGAADRGAAVGDHRLRRRVLRWQPEWAR